MAFLEWRRFNFFEVRKQVDDGTISGALQDTTITSARSGQSHAALGDSTGWVHLITKAWDIISFKAYEVVVLFVQPLPHDSILITIGEDEEGINPTLKIWDWSRLDRHGNPTCVRVSRVSPAHSPTLSSATALDVHQNKNLIAVGFADGSISVLRGDLTRHKKCKVRTYSDSSNRTTVTGIAFKGTQHLFVCFRNSVGMINLAGEKLVVLDYKVGGPSVLTENLFMVANPDAIYCYSVDGRGPCYALEGEKKRLDWFRNYLVITTVADIRREPTAPSHSTTKSNHVTILDIQNKFIVFSMTFEEIDGIFTEWGGLYILTKNKELLYLDEYDLKAKLNILFKKKMFDIAIRIATSDNYDNNGLKDLYKQFGDHLFTKGDMKGAIEQYLKTIGSLETSYVIRKYLDCRHLEPLTIYLEELHRKGYATKDHTVLLLTCFVKIDQFDHQGKLRQFINARDKNIKVDIDLTIEICRQISVEDALILAYNNNKHESYLQMVIDDIKDFSKALKYISNLEINEAIYFMKKYGDLLMNHLPKECTTFLKVLCTEYKPNEALPADSATSDDFLHLFSQNSEAMLDFLEDIIITKPDSSSVVYNTLIEHLVNVWSKNESIEDKVKNEKKILNILKSPDAKYDKDQALIICKMLNFTSGMLYLYEEKKLWRSALRGAMGSDDPESARALCRRRGKSFPQLWVDYFSMSPYSDYLSETLNVISNSMLLSPMLAIDLLSTSRTTLGDVRTFLIKTYVEESNVRKQEQELCAKYCKEKKENKRITKQLQKEPVIFQNSKCAACLQTLELPSIHFFCQHSYHQHCFESFSVSALCPTCGGSKQYAGVTQRVDNQSTGTTPSEKFHAHLESHNDPYAVVSEYLGRGLFNKVTLITEAVKASSEMTKKPMTTNQTHVSHESEARLRLKEGESNQMYNVDTASHIGVIPIPEGRMRVSEEKSMNKNIRKETKNIAIPLRNEDRSLFSKDCNISFKQNTSISSSLENTKMDSATKSQLSKNLAINPFKENYDESKNPFAEETDSPSNPFSDDDTDDYDKNRNPFQ